MLSSSGSSNGTQAERRTNHQKTSSLYSDAPIIMMMLFVAFLFPFILKNFLSRLIAGDSSMIQPQNSCSISNFRCWKMQLALLHMKPINLSAGIVSSCTKPPACHAAYMANNAFAPDDREFMGCASEASNHHLLRIWQPNFPHEQLITPSTSSAFGGGGDAARKSENAFQII